MAKPRTPTKIGQTLRRRTVAEIRLLHNGQKLRFDGYTHRHIEASLGIDAVEIARRTAGHMAFMLAIGEQSEAEIQIVAIEIETTMDIVENTVGDHIEIAQPNTSKVLSETVRHSSRSGL